MQSTTLGTQAKTERERERSHIPTTHPHTRGHNIMFSCVSTLAMGSNQATPGTLTAFPKADAPRATANHCRRKFPPPSVSLLPDLGQSPV